MRKLKQVQEQIYTAVAWLHHSEDCQPQPRGNPRLLSKCHPPSLSWARQSALQLQSQETLRQTGRKGLKTEAEPEAQEGEKHGGLQCWGQSLPSLDGSNKKGTGARTQGGPLQTGHVQGGRCVEKKHDPHGDRKSSGSEYKGSD